MEPTNDQPAADDGLPTFREHLGAAWQASSNIKTVAVATALTAGVFALIAPSMGTNTGTVLLSIGLALLIVVCYIVQVAYNNFQTTRTVTTYVEKRTAEPEDD